MFVISSLLRLDMTSAAVVMLALVAVFTTGQTSSEAAPSSPHVLYEGQPIWEDVADSEQKLLTAAADAEAARPSEAVPEGSTLAPSNEHVPRTRIAQDAPPVHESQEPYWVWDGSEEDSARPVSSHVSAADNKGGLGNAPATGWSASQATSVATASSAGHAANAVASASAASTGWGGNGHSNAQASSSGAPSWGHSGASAVATADADSTAWGPGANSNAQATSSVNTGAPSWSNNGATSAVATAEAASTAWSPGANSNAQATSSVNTGAPSWGHNGASAVATADADSTAWGPGANSNAQATSSVNTGAPSWGNNGASASSTAQSSIWTPSVVHSGVRPSGHDATLAFVSGWNQQSNAQAVSSLGALGPPQNSVPSTGSSGGWGSSNAQASSAASSHKGWGDVGASGGSVLQVASSAAAAAGQASASAASAGEAVASAAASRTVVNK